MAEEGGGLQGAVNGNQSGQRHRRKGSANLYYPRHSSHSPVECSFARVNGRDDDETIDSSGRTRYSSPEPGTSSDVPNGDDRTLSVNPVAFTQSSRANHGDLSNSTRSLYDTDITYVMENGRRYVADYFMPIDEEECDRLRVVHHVYLDLFDKALTTVPLNRPRMILDIGTGCGDWAIAMGDLYPEAEVIGTDIAKIQPTAVPLNVFFEIDDAEEEDGWTWPEDEFDLVHFRNMAGAFQSWDHVYSEAFLHLKPGGWIEVIDSDAQNPVFKIMGESSETKKFIDNMHKASEMSGRPKSTKHLDPKCLIDLGYEEVQVREFAIPLGGWPGVKTERNMGKLWLLAVMMSLEALALRNLTKHQGWSADEVRESIKVISDEVQATLDDPERVQGFFFIIKVLTGRKPGGAEHELDDDEMTTANNSESEALNDEVAEADDMSI